MERLQGDHLRRSVHPAVGEHSLFDGVLIIAILKVAGILIAASRSFSLN